jgi:hypothetical protein
LKLLTCAQKMMCRFCHFLKFWGQKLGAKWGLRCACAQAMCLYFHPETHTPFPILSLPTCFLFFLLSCKRRPCPNPRPSNVLKLYVLYFSKFSFNKLMMMSYCNSTSIPPPPPSTVLTRLRGARFWGFFWGSFLLCIFLLQWEEEELECFKFSFNFFSL